MNWNPRAPLLLLLKVIENVGKVPTRALHGSKLWSICDNSLYCEKMHP